jgi:VanZ family protein
MPCRSPSTRTVTVALVVYWVVLCIGTHLPGGFVGTPLVSDKTLHFLAYAGLSFLIAMLLPLLGLRDSRVYLIALLVAVGYGAVDELGQILIPGRTADAVDWFADLAGAVVGLVCYRLMVGVLTMRPFGLNGQEQCLAKSASKTAEWKWGGERSWL